MFRLHKTRPTKSGEKIDFKLSNFKVVQVPKGWERLIMSLISGENGKTIAKTGKAVVRNGSCQWAETLSESIWVSPSKQMEDSLFKLVVATGSGRSGILGEATVNMTDYITSTAIVPVSLPLKKCNHGTVLQVKIHCLTPRPKLMHDEPKQTNGHGEDNINEPMTMSLSSNGTESVESPHSQDLVPAQLGTQVESREASFSTSGSNHSYDSAESSIGKASFSTVSNLGGDDAHKLKQTQEDSPTSQNSLSQSNHSSFESQIMGSQSSSTDNQQEFPASTLRAMDSSKNLLEAAEKTIEQLHAEAKMWKRNADKLTLDLDLLKQEFSAQSKNLVSLEMELSAANAASDGLRKEVEQLKLLVEKGTTMGDSTVEEGSEVYIQKELENEMKFHQESNANLALQLKKSQDANAELVSVLQELESSAQLSEEENRKLRKSEESFQAKVQALENALKGKEEELKNGRSLNSNAILDIEEEYQSKLAAKEREIVGLKVKVAESVKERNLESRKGGDAHLIREIEALKSKLEELESDCNELTDENLELLLKLKETKNHVKGGVAFTGLSSNEVSTCTGSETSEDESQMLYLEEKLKKKILREIQNDYNSYIQELESQKIESEVEVAEVGKELTRMRSEVQILEAAMWSKEEENMELRRNEGKLEADVCNLQREKVELDEKIEAIQREGDIATKCLDDLRNEMMVLSSSMEDENKQLSLRLSDLESQLEGLKDERDSTRQQLEDSRSLATSLKDELTRARDEMGAQKLDMEKQLQEKHDQWLASQDKCESLTRENAKLQATTDTLIEECNSLQKSAEDSRKEKSDLDEYCACLEAKLRESEKSLTNCSTKIEVLEENLTLMMEDFASKERSLTLELIAVNDKNKKLEAKLKLEESSWNQMYQEKANEVENLRQDVEKLVEKIYAIQDENEKKANDAQNEISSLLGDKSRLELALQEAESKVKCTASELEKAQSEAKTKVEGLMGELADCREVQDKLMAEHEKALKLLESYKSSEGKLKTIVSGLELKLTVSEYERQQASEQSNNMKIQQLKLENLEDDISTLRDEHNAIKSDKEKLESSLHLVSRECDDLKAEKISFIQQISTLQKVASELEDYKEKKAALEEKLVLMESDLRAKEALLMQDAELKNELHHIKRTNRQFQQQIKQLQEEKDELLIKAQTLEEKVKLKMEEKPKQRQSNSNKNQQKREDNNNDIHDGVDHASKIQLLENELAKAMEVNNKYKTRLNRLSEGRKSQSNTPKKPSAEGEVVPKEKYERTKSSLEAELRDIRDRYRHMSLKYAEVEAQREELVMKLKGIKNMRRWFSNPSN